MKIAISVLLILFQFGKLQAKDSGKQMYIHPNPAAIDTNVILPPAWAFGIIYGAYTNQQQSIELVDQIIRHDYPIDAFWIDSWIWDWQNQGKGPKKYIDFVADTISYPNMKALWTDYLGNRGIKAGMWVWDCIQKTGNEAVYDDFKTKGFFANEFIHTSSWHNGSRTTIIGDKSQEVVGTWTGNINFRKPEAIAYFKQNMKHFFDKGIDFIKLDKTDSIEVCKAMFEMSHELGLETKGRGFVLSHSHGVDREEYKRYPGKWTDDTRSDWSAHAPMREFSSWLPMVGFRENIAMYTDTSKHFHKIPFLANDMGGFAVSLDQKIDKELYIRWTQFAMFVPLTTPFSQPENPSGNIAFKISDEADSIYKKFAHQKMELFPYIYSAAHRSRLESVNTIRPVPGYLYQYLFGDQLLVAPVCELYQRKKEVFLPNGNDWCDYKTGKQFKGGQTITVDAHLDEIPVFAKKGAIIPLRKYARSIESGTNDTLVIQIFPGSKGKFELIEDDGSSNDYLNGKYAVTKFNVKQRGEKEILTIDPVKGHYHGMQSVRTIKLRIIGEQKITKAKVNGKKLDYKQIDPFTSETNYISLDKTELSNFTYIFVK